MEPWREELYHHGILGMKWGKKNGPPYPLDASDHSAEEKKAGYKKSLGSGRNEHLYDRKKASISKKYDKKIAKADKYQSKIQAAREKNRERISSKYDKKIQKIEADRDSYDPIKEGLIDKNGRVIFTKEDVSSMVDSLNKEIEKHKTKKDSVVKDFDNGTEYVNAGMKKYRDVIENYKNVKLSSVDDKAYKGSDEYKRAVKEYTNQVLLDFMYSSAVTKLGYVSDYATGSHKYTIDFDKKKKRVGV